MLSISLWCNGQIKLRFCLSIAKVDEQFVILQERLQLTDDDLRLRQLLCQLLETALQEVLPDCKINQFGSSVSNFLRQYVFDEVTYLSYVFTFTKILFTSWILLTCLF